MNNSKTCSTCDYFLKPQRRTGLCRLTGQKRIADGHSCDHWSDVAYGVIQGRDVPIVNGKHIWELRQ